MAKDAGSVWRRMLWWASWPAVLVLAGGWWTTATRKATVPLEHPHVEGPAAMTGDLLYDRAVTEPRSAGQWEPETRVVGRAVVSTLLGPGSPVKRIPRELLRGTIRVAPDGAALAGIRGEPDPSGSQGRVWVGHMGDTDLRAVSIGAGRCAALEWVTDDAVAVVAVSEAGGGSLVIVSATTGVVEELAGDVDPFPVPSAAPKAAAVAYVTRVGGVESVAVRHLLASTSRPTMGSGSGGVTTSAAPGRVETLGLSSDGSMLAFVSGGRLWARQVVGTGEARLVAAVDGSQARWAFTSVAWSPDKSWLAAGVMDQRSHVPAMVVWDTHRWVVRAATGGMGLAPQRLVWSPDSKWVVGSMSGALVGLNPEARDEARLGRDPTCWDIPLVWLGAAEVGRSPTPSATGRR